MPDTLSKTNLSYSFDGAVATISLNDGKGNILDHLMMKELHHILDDLEQDKDLKLILLEGKDKHFSFGASVEEHTKEKSREMLSVFHKLFYTILEISIPVATTISGQCLGGGMELALISNFIFADKTARFGQPEIVLGVFPPPASLLLPLKLGSGKAEELLITGKSISAIKAKEIGLVNELYEDRTTMDAQVEIWVSDNIISKSASSLRFANRASRTYMRDIIRKYLPKLEEMYLDELMQTKDANEGIASFMEERKPVWENC